ncbi:MAG TPA: oligosaccharide flippase family protein [Bacteroidia bacterium]
MNPLKKLAGQTAIYGLPTIVGRLLAYFLVPLYTYNFTRAQYGTVSEMYAYVSFLLVVLTYGMETALFNFSARAEKNDTEARQNVFSTILTTVSITSVLFISLLVLFAQPIANLIQYPDHPEYVRWFGFILGLDAITSIAFAKLRERNRARQFAIIKTINIAVNILLNVFFIGLCKPGYDHDPGSFFGNFYNPGIGIGYIFISNLIASTVTLLVLLPAFFSAKFSIDKKLLRQVLPYALPLLIAGLAGMTNETIDRILIKYLVPGKEGLEQNGIYGACYKISIIMTIFVQTFRYAAEPFFFSHARETGARDIYARVMNYFVIVCMLIFLGTMMNISWIQKFVGPDFRSGLAVVPILLMANFCLGAFFNLSIWYKLTGHTRWGAYLTVYGAVVTLVINFAFIPVYGYMASAWATLICYASMMVISYFVGNKYYPVDYDLKKILGYIVLALGLYFFSSILTSNDWAPFALLIVRNFLLLVFAGVVFTMERKDFSLKT